VAEVVYDSAEPEGFAMMIGELVRANCEADPARARMLRTTKGVVNIRVTDAGVAVGLLFGGGKLRVLSQPAPRANLDVSGDAETIMSLSTVKLLGGLPSVLDPAGREVTRKLLNGKLKVRGLFGSLPLLMRLNRMMSTSS